MRPATREQWRSVVRYRRSTDCRCHLCPGMTIVQLVELGTGCHTDYVCPVLDHYRRLLGNSPEIPEELRP